MTWGQVLADPTIDLIEHPILPALMNKHIMQEDLGRVLTQLDGNPDWVDMFYRRDPVNHSILRFIDEDGKADILDWAVDEGCLPPMSWPPSGPESAYIGSKYHSSHDFHIQLEAEHARVRARDERALTKCRRAPKQKIRKLANPIMAEIAGRRKALAKMHVQLGQIVNERVAFFYQTKIEKAQQDLQALVQKSKLL